MDANRFDAISRSLATMPSRRMVLRLLAGSALGGTLGWLHNEESAAHDAREDCKKKSGRAKRRCLKRAKAHNATHCGPCTGGTCTNAGVCTCPGIEELCQGACREACGIDQIRNHGDCSCCVENDRFCQPGGTPCCSGTCSSPSPSEPPTCQGRADGASCTFDGQCDSGNCQGAGPHGPGFCNSGEIGP
jgi:hypothetical protein